VGHTRMLVALRWATRQPVPRRGDRDERSERVAARSGVRLADAPRGVRPVGLAEEREAGRKSTVEVDGLAIEEVVGALRGQASLAGGELQPPDIQRTGGAAF